MGYRAKQASILIAVMTLLSVGSAEAMHIMEGFLPETQSLFWTVVSLPFVLYGFYKIKKEVSIYPERKMILALAGAFIFVLSALKIPSVTGSSSHATGVGLAALLFGPSIAAALAIIVLLFQALLLAHGGITTLGANVFSMGIVGGFVAWIIFSSLKGSSKRTEQIAVFFAASLGDLATYAVTSGQLAFAYPDSINGMMGSFIKFMSIFSITQIPLAICEGLLAVVVYNTLLYYADQGMISIWWHNKEDKQDE